MAILTAVVLIALGALAGVVIATALAIRGLPDAVVSAALPDDMVDEYVSSLRGTWRGYATKKIVAISRSRVLGLIWKGSWAPILITLATSAVVVSAVCSAAYFELLPISLAAACAALPLLNLGILVFVLQRLAIGFVSKGIGRLRAAAVDEVTRRFQKLSPTKPS